MRQDYYIVEFHGFGSTSLDVLLYCFIDAEDWNEELRTRHVLNLDIMRLAESLQVDFAFPTQTLHIAEMPGQPQQLPQIPDRTHLRDVVNSFGPGGKSGQRVDQPITDGHERRAREPLRPSRRRLTGTDHVLGRVMNCLEGRRPVGPSADVALAAVYSDELGVSVRVRSSGRNRNRPSQLLSMLEPNIEGLLYWTRRIEETMIEVRGTFDERFSGVVDAFRLERDK